MVMEDASVFVSLAVAAVFAFKGDYSAKLRTGNERDCDRNASADDSSMLVLV